MSDIGRFRKIFDVDWRDPVVQQLSPTEFRVFAYAYAGPQTTSAGCFRLSSAVAVEDLRGMSTREFDRAFGVVCVARGWSFDPITRVLWQPEFLSKNPPQSPNVVKSWRRLLGDVPDCEVKADAIDAMHAYLKDMAGDKADSFRAAFGSYSVSLPASFVENPTIQGDLTRNSEQRARRRASARKRGADGNGSDNGRPKRQGATAHDEHDDDPRVERLRPIVEDVLKQKLATRDANVDAILNRANREPGADVRRAHAEAALARVQQEQQVH